MRAKLFVEFCLTTLVVFLLAGDFFLPQPYRSGTQQFKVNVNHFIVGLLPSRKTVIELNTKIDSED